MRKIFLLSALLVAAAPSLWVLADTPETADATAETEADAEYVVREEKVLNFETGRVEVETVIEFPELEIFPELARPVGIIIPRTKPDFDEILFTIYNNEPSYNLPEEYRSRYYRRIPLGGNPPGEVKTGDVFKPVERDDDRGEDADGG